MRAEAPQEDWLVLEQHTDLTYIQAHAALLEEHGVESYVQDVTDSVYPSLTRFRLFVPASFLEEAKRAIEQEQCRCEE